MKSQSGGMLVELLMSVAIMAIALPFVFRYQQNAVMRAKNVAVVRHMESMQTALERYITEHSSELLRPVGRNITRVNPAVLVEYGADASVADNPDDYQVRILKTPGDADHATLQGVIVQTNGELTALRTREVVNMGGANMGFVEDRHAFGAFGAWHADTVDLGVAGTDAIVGTTQPMRGNVLYLWRVPSDNSSDATMMSGLSLGGHNIVNTMYLNAASARFDEMMSAAMIASGEVVFQSRVALDKEYRTRSATVAGTLSSDSRNMDVVGEFNLRDLGKFSNFVVSDLWVTKLALAGLSINTGDDDEPAILQVNQMLDMTAGRIEAMYVTVGFTGSVTPRLVVNDRIEDSTNSSYFWDTTGVAHFADVQLDELNRMAPMALSAERANGTDATTTFSSVAANKNATAGDFINAINEISSRVRAKYRLLNLE